jgi:DNA-directed RNA polymerase specialized sigma24 family protein/ribosome-associated translation inhibitor RaiA
MSEHMIFHNCSPWQKNTIRSYWSRKLPRIYRLLQHFPEDQRELRLTVRRNADHFDARIVLLLPTGTLVAENSSRTDFSAIDAAVDTLTTEIRRHKGHIRHDDGYRRKHHRHELFRHPAVLLESDIRRPDRETFFELLRPVMDRLRGHTHHELIAAQQQERIRSGQITVPDVLDEVLLRAWTQFQEKDMTEPLEVWLVRLLHDVLDEQLSDRPATVSVYEPIGTGEPPDEAQSQPVIEDESPGDELPPETLDDVLPDQHAAEPWEALEVQDEMKWVLTQLGRVPSQQRRAFTLHLLDGLDPDEIAMIQRRDPNGVRADIEAVQHLLRDRFAREMQAEPLEAGSARRTGPESIR